MNDTYINSMKEAAKQMFFAAEQRANKTLEIAEICKKEAEETAEEANFAKRGISTFAAFSEAKRLIKIAEAKKNLAEATAKRAKAEENAKEAALFYFSSFENSEMNTDEYRLTFAEAEAEAAKAALKVTEAAKATEAAYEKANYERQKEAEAENIFSQMMKETGENKAERKHAFLGYFNEKKGAEAEARSKAANERYKAEIAEIVFQMFMYS